MGSAGEAGTARLKGKESFRIYDVNLEAKTFAEEAAPL